MNSMQEAFEDLIKDSYNAEKQITKALPKMIKKASNEQLRMGFEQHLEETNEQIKMLEEVAKMCGFKPTGKVCPAMQGLIEEADEHLKEGKPGPVMDAVMIATAQKVEHYEICAYGTARTWAQQIGYTDCVPMIEKILQQEEATDKKLNELAINMVNEQAIENPETEAKSKSNGKASASKASSSKSGTAKKSSSPRGKVSVR